MRTIEEIEKIDELKFVFTNAINPKVQPAVLINFTNSEYNGDLEKWSKEERDLVIGDRHIGSLDYSEWIESFDEEDAKAYLLDNPYFIEDMYIDNLDDVSFPIYAKIGFNYMKFTEENCNTEDFKKLMVGAVGYEVIESKDFNPCSTPV